ncbi:MAG: phage holin family protein [Muribaculaceae bacterium]|nr:phage holin family protein [Muribaculaceae bacterium]
MWSLILNLLLTALALFLSARICPGVTINSFGGAIITAIVLGLVNMLIKPLLMILSLPITVLTLGLFVLVINTLLIMLVSYFVSSFHVNGFWTAFLFSIIYAVVCWIIQALVGIKF